MNRNLGLDQKWKLPNEDSIILLKLFAKSQFDQMLLLVPSITDIDINKKIVICNTLLHWYQIRYDDILQRNAFITKKYINFETFINIMLHNFGTVEFE